MTGCRASRVLYCVAGTAAVGAVLAFLGAVWTGPNTALSDKLGGTGGVCLGTAFVTGFVGLIAGER